MTASTQNSIKNNAIRNVLTFLFRHWRQEKAMVALTAAGMGAATCADLMMPLYSGRLIDAVSRRDIAPGDALHAALHALALMAVLGALLVCGRHIGFLAIIRLTTRLMSRFASNAFWRVQRFSTDWQANNFAGSIVRRVTRGMWATDLMNDTLLLALLPAVVVLVGSSIILGMHWPTMGAIVATGAALYITLSIALSLRYVAPAARLSNAQDTRIGGAMADAVTCNAVVKAFGAEKREDLRLSKVVDKWSARTFRTWTRGTRSGTVQLMVLLALRITVILYVLLLWKRGFATPGDVAFVLTSYFIIHGYLRDIGQHVANLQRSVNDMEEMVEIDALPLGIVDREGAKPIQLHSGDIRFDHVTFRYGAHATPLFREFSLHIPGGQRVGLVGHSGSGKTTFVKLLHRLYDINDGQILVDGQNIAAVRQDSLRSQMALVPQEPILFHRSLAENISYGKPNATREQIETAARLAHAEEFILRQPKQYATLVGERGVKLSGGERQRIALARAFLADTPVLILDEATSSLDSESEALIQEATERLMVGRTSIIIAHRLSTVRMLDRILVFDHGEIVEEGTHDELVSRADGVYKRLFDRQALGLLVNEEQEQQNEEDAVESWD
jgi:ATP-binding cassette subfamily B protein